MVKKLLSIILGEIISDAVPQTDDYSKQVQCFQYLCRFTLFFLLASKLQTDAGIEKFIDFIAASVKDGTVVI